MLPMLLTRTSSLLAKAGQVTCVFYGQGSLRHDWATSSSNRIAKPEEGT